PLEAADKHRYISRRQISHRDTHILICVHLCPSVASICSYINLRRNQSVAAAGDSGLMALVRAIALGDAAAALRLLAVSPVLVSARAEDGATRQAAKEYHLKEIGHYIYEGDTALHIAAAAYRLEIVRKLIAMGGDVRARNRRGAEPLHYA